MTPATSNNFFRIFIALVACTICTQLGFSAKGEAALEGVILDENDQALPGASVMIEELKLGKVTDENGHFQFSNLPAGLYHLEISFVGYNKLQKEVSLKPGQHLDLKLGLRETRELMSEVEVRGKSLVSQRREQAVNVGVLSTKELKDYNLDVNQTLNLMTGIRVRQEGGLGSGFRFSLNGFTGDQVRFFLDGVPMSYFGEALSLNNFPVNLIDRIEVYKGVVPVELGADALGGAVNVISSNQKKSFADLSYSYGSFNTHRAALRGHYYHEKTGFVFNLMGFHNYSDNNFEIDVEIPNEDRTISGTTTIERFHDAYRSSALQVEAGFQDKSFADELLFGFTASGNYNEIQHGYVVRDAFGQVHSTSSSMMPSLRYRKDDFLLKGLSVKAFAMYTQNSSTTVDTASRSYDWFGNFVVNDSKEQGELSNFRKSLFSFNDQALLGTLTAKYQLQENQKITFNYTGSSFTREGEDPLAIYQIPFDEPNTIDKQILGLSYSIDLLDERLKLYAFAKEFLMNAHTVAASYGDYETFDSDFAGTGMGVAAAYHLDENWLVKSSFENTYRLPNPTEMFGNGILQQPNPELQPEQSKNYNLGLSFTGGPQNHEIFAEVSGLYRQATGFIRYRTNGITGYFENLRDVNILGGEAQFRYTFKRKLSAGVNLTYQDMRTEEGWRIPNEPYLFGNADFQYFATDFLKEGNRLSLRWNIRYVAPFYLFWAQFGAEKYDVPKQIVQDFGISYSLDDNKYNISLECSNLLDQKVYDNYGLQKPGRAFFVKLQYHFEMK